MCRDFYIKIRAWINKKEIYDKNYKIYEIKLEKGKKKKKKKTETWASDERELQ